MGLIVGILCLIFTAPILRLITNDEVVIDYAFKKMLVVAPSHILCGLMEVFSLSLRSLGKSVESMIICLCGSTIFRIIYVNIIYSVLQDYVLVFSAYPISWFMTSAVLLVYLLSVLKKVKQKFENEKTPKSIAIILLSTKKDITNDMMPSNRKIHQHLTPK